MAKMHKTGKSSRKLLAFLAFNQKGSFLSVGCHLPLFNFNEDLNYNTNFGWSKKKNSSDQD